MRTEHVRIYLSQPGSTGPTSRPGLLRKLAAAIAGAALLVGAFMVSVVVLAAVAVAGVVAGGWLWWKTRELRKRIREQVRAREQADGRVIEGEVLRDPD